ncbi:DNA methyltransferase [Neotabrizicola sp. sgz301269]|uniref:DNA methyltransferase n=1 Tax=Neotabrizicola sp. sgz301269 TaxID=3276282 RepID=UPI00376FC7B6
MTVGLENAAQTWQTPRVSIGPYTRDKGQTGAERLTLEGQSQMWGTPRASDAEKGGPNQSFGAGGMPLPAQAAQWATPAPMQTREGWTAEQIEAAREIEKAKGQNGNGFGLGLAAQAGIWPTPTCQDSTQSPAPPSKNGRTDELVFAAAAWPTPSARDYRTPNNEPFQDRGGGAKGDQLPNFVAHCFTPPAQRTWTSGVSPSIWRPISRRLFRSAMSSVSPTVQRRWLRKGSWRKRRLNPSFVEWLMSWPPGHAVCACSETGFIHWQQHMRGALSALPTASGPWIWAPPSVAAAPEQMSLWG